MFVYVGSSAPEILLSVIEVFGNNFEAGDLGPGTIVGSAAFNLFVIVAICIAVGLQPHLGANFLLSARNEKNRQISFTALGDPKW